MNERRNLLIVLGEWWEQRCTASGELPGRLRRVLRWLMPNGGTLLLVALLVATAQVWAKPLASPAGAPGPSAATVNYQGCLANPDGSPVTDGNYGMTFALYAASSGGSPVWGPESHAAVPVSGGLFSVGLGSQTSGGIPNNGWQNTCYDPTFTWSASDVGGSGIKGYYYCWSTDPNCNPTTWTTDTSFDPAAIAPADGTAAYYLNVKARDNQNRDSSITSFGVRYDGAAPTVTLQINGRADTTNQTTVHLNLSAGDTGSGVANVRISNNGIA